MDKTSENKSGGTAEHGAPRGDLGLGYRLCSRHLNFPSISSVGTGIANRIARFGAHLRLPLMQFVLQRWSADRRGLSLPSLEWLNEFASDSRNRTQAAISAGRPATASRLVARVVRNANRLSSVNLAAQDSSASSSQDTVGALDNIASRSITKTNEMVVSHSVDGEKENHAVMTQRLRPEQTIPVTVVNQSTDPGQNTAQLNEHIASRAAQGVSSLKAPGRTSAASVAPPIFLSGQKGTGSARKVQSAILESLRHSPPAAKAGAVGDRTRERSAASSSSLTNPVIHHSLDAVASSTAAETKAGHEASERHPVHPEVPVRSPKEQVGRSPNDAPGARGGGSQAKGRRIPVPEVPTVMGPPIFRRSGKERNRASSASVFRSSEKLPGLEPPAPAVLQTAGQSPAESGVDFHQPPSRVATPEHTTLAATDVESRQASGHGSATSTSETSPHGLSLASIGGTDDSGLRPGASPESTSQALHVSGDTQKVGFSADSWGPEPITMVHREPAAQAAEQTGDGTSRGATHATSQIPASVPASVSLRPENSRSTADLQDLPSARRENPSALEITDAGTKSLSRTDLDRFATSAESSEVAFSSDLLSRSPLAAVSRDSTSSIRSEKSASQSRTHRAEDRSGHGNESEAVTHIIPRMVSTSASTTGGRIEVGTPMEPLGGGALAAVSPDDGGSVRSEGSGTQSQVHRVEDRKGHGGQSEAATHIVSRMLSTSNSGTGGSRTEVGTAVEPTADATARAARGANEVSSIASAGNAEKSPDAPTVLSVNKTALSGAIDSSDNSAIRQSTQDPARLVHRSGASVREDQPAQGSADSQGLTHFIAQAAPAIDASNTAIPTTTTANRDGATLVERAAEAETTLAPPASVIQASESGASLAAPDWRSRERVPRAVDAENAVHNTEGFRDPEASSAAEVKTSNPTPNSAVVPSSAVRRADAVFRQPVSFQAVRGFTATKATPVFHRLPALPSLGSIYRSSGRVDDAAGSFLRSPGLTHRTTVALDLPRVVDASSPRSVSPMNVGNGRTVLARAPGSIAGGPAPSLPSPNLPTVTNQSSGTLYGLKKTEITQLANRVYELLVRRIANERQRRGQ